MDLDSQFFGPTPTSSTPWKINIEPENHWVGEESSLPKVHFQVPMGARLIFPGVGPLVLQLCIELFFTQDGNFCRRCGLRRQTVPSCPKCGARVKAPWMAHMFHHFTKTCTSSRYRLVWLVWLTGPVLFSTSMCVLSTQKKLLPMRHQPLNTPQKPLKDRV